MDKKIEEGFREVADRYNKLREKFLKSLDDMKKEVPNGFVPGSRIIDNNEMVIYYNPPLTLTLKVYMKLLQIYLWRLII